MNYLAGNFSPIPVRYAHKHGLKEVPPTLTVVAGDVLRSISGSVIFKLKVRFYSE